MVDVPGIPSILTVGEVARRSGVTVSALHFYEKEGLIRSMRTSGNQRRYARETLRRVSFVRAAQQVGISLAEVAVALQSLPDGRTPTREDWTRLSSAWRVQLDGKIRQLKLLRDNLDDCIGCGCLSIDRCRLRNPRDKLAVDGPGPVRLV